MMLAALTIMVLFAGVAYSATGDGTAVMTTYDDADCTTRQEVLDTCSSHLHFLEDEKVKEDLKSISEIDDPVYLIETGLEKVCSNPDHLMMYFECVFTNLTTCLKEDNKTEISLPIPDHIADGVNNLCNNKAKINTSCIVDESVEVEQCYKGQDVSGGTQCSNFDSLVDCTEKFMTMCEGGEVILDYVTAGRPQVCDSGSGTGMRLAAVLSVILSVHISFLFSRV